MGWIDSFTPREQDEILKARVHSQHLYDVNCISFLVTINSGTAMEIITKMAELLDKHELALRSALECIARLTPFPVEGQPESLQQAINETADYADYVRNQIRELIK